MVRRACVLAQLGMSWHQGGLQMARKRYNPEEIVARPQQVDVVVSQGQSMAEAICQIRMSEVTYYRWRQEFGGQQIEQVKRLKDLELENIARRGIRPDAGQAHSAGGGPGMF
jgi:putative transposase